MALFAAKAITSSGEPLTGRHYLEIYLACLSYANLCFLNVWLEINDRGYDFWCKYTVTWQTLTALTLEILIVASVTWGLVYLALRSGRGRWISLLKWCMILALLLPLNVLRTDDAFISLQRIQIPHPIVLRILIIAGGAALGIMVLLYWQRLSARVVTVLLVLMAPTMPIAIAMSAWRVIHGPPGGRFPDKPLQPALPQSPDKAHVIWVLFDEWDDALTFSERPAGVLLPEVDGFRKQAFRATRMFPPARETLVSVPSLLTGKTYVVTEPQGPSEVKLTYDRGKPPVLLTIQDTIFTEARRRGLNIGIAGWFFPYCRLIPECTTCSWHSAIGLSAHERFENPGSILHLMMQILVGQFKKIPLIQRMGLDLDMPIHQRLHALSYSQVHDDMLKAIVDPRLNLVYVHMNVPHRPNIYDYAADRMSADRNSSYRGNLRLVDLTIRDIRETLERAGMWDCSTILLTADHPLRLGYGDMGPDGPSFIKGLKQHAEVPYLLKMPGETQGLTYTKPVLEVVTKDLLLAILSKQVTTSQQVSAWLDANPPRP